MKRNSSGQFVGKPKKGLSTSTLQLPSTNEEVVKLYQKYRILPSQYSGLNLVLKQTDTRDGDKLNNNLTFLVPGTNIYPSIRPQLQRQDKHPLVLTHRILYLLLLNVPHMAIAQQLGWVYINANDNTIANLSPIGRLRRN